MDSIEDFQLADILNEITQSIQFLSRQTSLSSSSSSLDMPIAFPPSQLYESVNFDHFNYNIWDLYTPDIWTLLLFFFITICVKLSFWFGLRKSAVSRTRAALSEKFGHPVETEVARSVLKKPLAYV